MNNTLKLLIASDTLLNGGLGLASPILAIYITQQLPGGTLTFVGLATMIFLLTKVFFQLIFSKVFSPKHRFFMVIVGTTLIAATPFIYIFARSLGWFIFAQIIYGIGGGLAYPAWFSLFASNLDKGKQGFEWALYSGSVGIAVAAAAYAGSWIAKVYGFNWVFFFTGVFSLAGMIILLGLERDNLKKILPSEMFVAKHKPSH